MQAYNHTRNLFNTGAVDLTALRVMLVGAGYTFDATQTAMTAATAEQVSGNGWTAGGEPVANASISVVNTNESRLTGDNLSINATGGDIGPASGFVFFDNENSNPLFYENFAGPKTADEGQPFAITWDADGIYLVKRHD